MLTATQPRVRELSAGDRQRMLQLMRMTYANVSRDSFESDLTKKDRAVLLWDRATLCGFSTIALWRSRIWGRDLKVVFSGDTVVDERHRNSLALPTAWCSLMAEELRKDPEALHYWLLTSKGYKTYRYLPVFFVDYFPKVGRKLTWLEEQVLRSSLRALGIGNIDRGRWVVRASHDAQRLRPGVADITPERRLRSEIAFFETMNPGHARGDELVCLARIAEDNFHPRLWKRMVEAPWRRLPARLAI